MVQVLFVCLGNICRSPMAEGVFQKLVDDTDLTDQFKVDSAGTGDWHVGNLAHAGTRAILQQHDIVYNGRSRQINKADMANQQTYIIGMDNSNLSILRQRYGEHPNLYRLLDFASSTKETEVPDPYYTNNFEIVYQLVLAGCTGLLATIRQKQGL